MREGIVAVISRGEHILVVRRAPGIPFPGYWCPVSGKLEPGERQQDAVVREVREELGVASVALRKVWECPTSDGAYWLHWWTVKLVDESAALVLEPREVSDARWIRPTELRTLGKVFEADVEFFEQIYPQASAARQ